MVFKTKKTIIRNRNVDFPEPTFKQTIRYIRDEEGIIRPTVILQAKQERNIVYGGRAVNALVGHNQQRKTHDWDIYSRKPLVHAHESENRIDHRFRADMAHVEGVPYDDHRGKDILWRVVITPLGKPVIDYSRMPKKKIPVVVKDGVMYESLGAAEVKYNRILRVGPERRLYKSFVDINRIQDHRINMELKKIV